jgi:hypothetical protein
VSKIPRLDSAIVVTDRGLEIVPACAVPTRTKLMTRPHAEELLADLTKVPVEAVVRRAFGPGVEA